MADDLTTQAAQQQSYFFPSSAGPPPSGPRMLNVREVVTTISDHAAELKAAERERVAQKTQEAVAQGGSPTQVARRVSEAVTDVAKQSPGTLASAHRVAVEAVATAAPAQAPAITQAVGENLKSAYAGESTATVERAA